MRKKKILIFVAAGVLLSILGEVALNYLGAITESQTLTLGDAIQTVRLVGADTAVKLRSAPTEIHQLHIETEDNPGCGLSARIQQESAALTINLEKSGSWLTRWWCDPDVTISMPETLNLAIDLENLVAELAGEFKNVSIESKHSVISFDGLASYFRLNGSAAIVNLDLDKAMPKDAIALNVGKLISHVSVKNP